jgi:hypothetical protein
MAVSATGLQPLHQSVSFRLRAGTLEPCTSLFGLLTQAFASQNLMVREVAARPLPAWRLFVSPSEDQLGSYYILGVLVP